MSELHTGVAIDGKVFTTEDEAVKSELIKGVDEPAAIGNAIMAHEQELKSTYGDPLPEMIEIVVSEKNKADFPEDFEQANVGDTVAVPLGKLARYR